MYHTPQIGNQVDTVLNQDFLKFKCLQTNLQTPSSQEVTETKAGQITTKVQFDLTKMVHLIPDEPHNLARGWIKKGRPHMNCN